MNMMRNRYIGVTLLAALGFTACQHLYYREMADNHDEVLRIQYEINQLKEDLVAIKERFPKQYSCPPNWTSFGTSCYLVFKEKKTHGNAAMHCMRFGSKLVEIETAEEDDFINLLSRPKDQLRFWIGGTDAVVEQNWFWLMTGKPITTFENWRTGEPSNAYGREHCLELWKELKCNGTWNDAPCSNTKQFICEKNVFY